MADYRVYQVASDGHFIGYDAFVCADDAEALKCVKRLVDRHDVEVWSGDRLVAKLEPTRHGPTD